MMRRLSLLVFLLFAVPFTSFAGKEDELRNATPEELALKSVDFAPGAPAVILDWYVRHDDQESWAVEYVRIKILTAEGKKYGDIEIPYIPGHSNLRDLKARTIRPDGTIVPFTAKPYEKLVIKSGGVKLMKKTFSLPEVEPGSILEYRYRREWSASQLMTNAWTMQKEIPIVRARLWVRPWQVNVSSFFTYSRVDESGKPQNVGDHYETEMRNIPPFEAEPYSPPEAELKPLIQFFYSNGKPDLEKYWTEQGRYLSDYIEGFVGNRSGIKKAALELTAGAATDDEKVRKIYARVQQFRNLSFEQELSEQEAKKQKIRDSRHVEDVWRDGYGYRSDINRLFVALVRGAGLEANVVRVAQRDERFFAKQLPDVDQLTGEVAVVKIGGQDRWFDPGTVHAPYGMLAWENTTVSGLRIERKSSGTWIETPKAEPSGAVTQRTADLKFVDDVLKGTVSVQYSGQEALQMRLEAHNKDEATNRKAIEDGVKGWFPDGTTVKLTRLSSLTASDEPLTADFDVELPNLGTMTGSRALVPLSVFAASRSNPFSAEKRKHPVYYHYPYEMRDRVTLALPEGFAIENLPKDVTLDAGGGRFTTAWKRTDHAVTLDRTFTIDVGTVNPAYYKPLRSFYSRVVAADQENLVLKKAAK
jgi:hypothetical protein